MSWDINHYWGINFLSQQDPVQGPVEFITVIMVEKAIKSIKSNKAAGPTEIAVEMVKAAGPLAVRHISHLTNIIKEEKIPEEWNLLYIINCHKAKGDALEKWNYRGLKMLDPVLKIQCWTCLKNHLKKSSIYKFNTIWFHAWKRNNWCYFCHSATTCETYIQVWELLFHVCWSGKSIW